MPVCEQCGKKFKVSVHPMSKNRFCSRLCYQTWKKETGWTKSVCEGCGKEFKHHAYLKRHFCSKKCQRTWRSEWMKGNKNVKKYFGKRWSYKYECCVDCGRNDRPHYAKGRCRICDGRYRDRVKKGTLGQSCIFCGEDRVVDAAHLIPRTEVGDRWEDWLVKPMCPTHHRLFDLDRLSDEERAVVAPLVAAARKRLVKEMKGGDADG